MKKSYRRNRRVKPKTRKRRTKRMATKKKRQVRRSRRMRGGSYLTPLGVVPTYPPGGMYIPGGINGINGGYYYGDLINPCLPDPISPTNLRGGGFTNYLPWGVQGLARSAVNGIKNVRAAYRGVPFYPGPFPI